MVDSHFEKELNEAGRLAQQALLLGVNHPDYPAKSKAALEAMERVYYFDYH